MPSFESPNGEGQSSDPAASSSAASNDNPLPFWRGDNGQGGSSSPPEPDISALIEKYKPGVKKFGFGTFMGYCSGVATKKIGQAMAFLVGVAFIALQSAVYTGYIEVDWDKMQKDAIKAVDTNSDGEISEKDLHNYLTKVKAILTNNIPDASGFSLGFLYGVGK